VRDEARLAYTDDPRLRGLRHTWVERSQMRTAQARALTTVILETGEDVRPNPHAHPNDATRLRGIPCIGIGVIGAIRGSRPEDALHELARRYDALDTL
jgi:hypothetical protein